MRCLIRSHHQDYKLPMPHEEGDVGGSLEPDPRYGRCCSAVCRPGYALRDALLGLLVLLGLAVVVTVIFVVCFYVLPDEKHLIEEGLLASTAEGIIREPVEVNEITLKDGDAYNLAPNDLGKSTVGRSQDFNTFSTAANFEDTTTQLSSADASQFTVFQDASDVVSPSRDVGRKPGLQGRENFGDDNFHEHREGQNERGDSHNLGHEGERPILENEGDQFKGEASRNKEETDFFADLTPQAACGPVHLPMCTSTVPWNLAGKPNWLGHLADQDVFASVAIVRRLLVESQCSALAPLYACSILEPPCRDSSVLPPCRNFCIDVARSCQVPVSSGIADMFDCERFPDSTDPNICVSAQQELLHLTNTAMNLNPAHEIHPENVQPPQSQPGLHLNQETIQHYPPVDSDSDTSASDGPFPLPPGSEIAKTQPDEDGLAICTMDMFMCLDGSDCLSHDYVCDGRQNCVDYSDEANCTSRNPEETTTTITTTPATTTTTTTESIEDKIFTADLPAETGMTLQRDHKPSTKRSTHIFSSPTASPSDAPTAMSLADRLKLAMSGSSTNSPLAADRPRRPSSPRRPNTNSVFAETSSSATNGDEDTTRSGFSLAARLSSIATENPRRFDSTARPKSISSAFAASPTVPTDISDDSIEVATNTGALSLAERLALLNKAKQPPKPTNRLQGRRQPFSTNNNRFTIDYSDAPTAIPRRHQTGLRNRFTSIPPSTEFHSSAEDGDVRRIPVRTIDEVPRFKLNFPKRYPTTERAVTFRTTPELTSPLTTEGTTEASKAPSIAEASSTTFEHKMSVVPSTTEPIVTTEGKVETSKVTSTTESVTSEICEELQCLDGKCIAINQLNDGVTDCSDGSDEQDFGGLVT